MFCQLLHPFIRDLDNFPIPKILSSLFLSILQHLVIVFFCPFRNDSKKYSPEEESVRISSKIHFNHWEIFAHSLVALNL